MIERFSLNDCLGFKKVSLEFKNGLILFSGASGAGKSVLLDSMLGLFGVKELHAKMAEASIDNQLDLQKFGIENEEYNVFRFIKGKSSRYFINDAQVSKKSVKKIASGFVDYLSLKSYKEFENSKIIDVLDELVCKKDIRHKKILDEFRENFEKFKKVEKELSKIEEEERKIEELREFAIYEIKKIEDISPIIGEYEELMEIKKALSKKDKVLDAIQKANPFFEYESYISEALSLLDIDSQFFDETINELKVHFETSVDKLNEFDDEKIEEVLDRLEKLSSLKQRYGSIEESLEHLKKKKEEVIHYDNISYEKEELKNSYEKLLSKCEKMGKEISKFRRVAIKELNSKINSYLNMLYLDNIIMSIKRKDMDINGLDKVEIDLWGNRLEKISSGEFNRVRLAFLSSFNDILNKETNSILVLDEVDANLSGKESMSIALLLKKLSKNYQIFAISHQPQLTSKADMHFLVYKKEGISKVKELKDKNEKINELARMISGKNITNEAMEFAKSLMEDT